MTPSPVWSRNNIRRHAKQDISPLSKMFTCCKTAGSAKGTWRVKTFKLVLGDMCSKMLKPRALQSGMDRTSAGKVMFIRATSAAKCPSVILNIFSPGTVSAGRWMHETSLQTKWSKKYIASYSLSISSKGCGRKCVVIWKKTLYLVCSPVASSVQSSSSIGSII